MKLLKSVGDEGINLNLDVRLVQWLLQKNMRDLIPFRPPILNGKCDDHCIELIRQFQSRVLKMRSPDGLVEVNGPTFKALMRRSATSPKRAIVIKRGGQVVPFFKQFDEDWSFRKLGTNKTIGRAGCAISSIAMILKYFGRDMDPGKLDQYLDENNGYEGDNVIWATAFKAGWETGLPTIKLTQYKFINKDQFEKILDDRIEKNWPTLAHIDYGADNNLGGDHWVVIVGKSPNGHFIINDPGTSQGNGAANPNQNITKLGMSNRKGGLNLVRLCLFDVVG